MKQFRKQCVPEWSRLYIDYPQLKQFFQVTKYLRKQILMNKLKKKDVLADDRIMSKLRQDNSDFISQLERNLSVVEHFVLYKYKDIKDKLSELQYQSKLAKLKAEMDSVEQRILVDSLYIFYKEILQYNQYITLNKDTIIKLLSKYNDQTFTFIQVEQKPNFKQIAIDIDILTQIEIKVKYSLSQISKTIMISTPNAKEGMKNIKRYREERKTNGITFFMIGMFLGISVITVMLIFMLRYEGYLDAEQGQVFTQLFPCFRGAALFLIYYWFLALDQYMWVSYRINYTMILGFNHHFSSVPQVLHRVSVLSAVFLILFIAYCFQVERLSTSLSHLNAAIEYYPLFIWIMLLGYVFIPTSKILNGEGRKWMFKMLFGALVTHFYAYEGRYTLVLDQFVSLLSPMRDLEYTVCYYLVHATKQQTDYQDYQLCYNQQRIASDILMMIVFSLKCLHCLSLARKNGKFYKTNEMWNFSKNLLAVSVGVIACMHKLDKASKYLWICAAMSFTLIQYWWELNKDFLFFEKDSTHKFLRSDLGFIDPKLYYFLGVLNLFVSATWVMTISPNFYDYIGVKNKEVFILIVGILEIIRRFIHNLIRIEKEHILNLRNFKAVKDLQYPYEKNECRVSHVGKSNYSSDAPGRISLYNEGFRLSNKIQPLMARLTHVSPQQIEQIDILLDKPYDLQRIKDASLTQSSTGRVKQSNQELINYIIVSYQ